MKQCLLLSNYFEPLAFIGLKRIARLLAKEKVEIISVWDDDYINWCSGVVKYPSILRLKYKINYINPITRFSRKSLFRRDQYCCQYCGKALSSRSITIDHVLPRSLGGKTNWENCVSACLKCNSNKRDRTPEQADMKLLSPPTIPTRRSFLEFNYINPKHEDWNIYIL